MIEIVCYESSLRNLLGINIAPTIIARMVSPVEKLPVRSLNIPIITGPRTPPTSPKEKYKPPAAPIFFTPTSRVFIKIVSRSGDKAPMNKPMDAIQNNDKLSLTKGKITMDTAVMDNIMATAVFLELKI